MGRHIERCRSDYWGAYSWPIGKNRWEQIHRFLAFNIDPSTETSSISYKLELVATNIRNNCRSAVMASSWVAIDEVMVAFNGQSIHKTSIKNKPILVGFKIWALGFDGFIYDQLWHSGRDDVEECPKTVRFQEVPHFGEVNIAPTRLIPIRLYQKLRARNPYTKYVVILDNLFLNVSVAYVLLKYDIGYLGTTRKNVDGILSELLDAKNHNKLLQ